MSASVARSDDLGSQRRLRVVDPPDDDLGLHGPFLVSHQLGSSVRRCTVAADRPQPPCEELTHVGDGTWPELRTIVGRVHAP